MMPADSERTPSSATCLLCHTVDDTITQEALRAGAAWRCARCGQTWSAARLAAAAAYARFAAGRSVGGVDGVDGVA